MCGIGGVITYPESGAADHAAKALAMASAQRHRGPDGVGVWSAPTAGMAVARLTITGGRERGRQPALDPRGGVLVFNGEIYNFRALGGGPQAGHASDTEVLASLLARRGQSVLPALDGPFALARYDQITHRLLLARDRAGKKPLYFARTTNGWAFASTLVGLHVATGPLQLRSEAIYEYLVFRSVGGQQSAFAGVRQVPPGTWLELDADGIRRHGRYWEPPPPDHELVPVQSVREVIDGAVTARADLTREVGIFLSGGLDSAAVAASLRRQFPDQPVRFISVGYDVAGIQDERPFALRAGAAIGGRHEQLIVHGERDVPELMADAACLLEDPVQDPVTLPTLALARAAAAFTRVVLTGDGSDELWGGYERFSLPPADITDYLPRTAIFLPAELGLNSWPITYLDGVDLPSAPMDPLDRILRLEFANRLRNYHLSRIDKLIMGSGVEPRCPFLDPAVVQVALSIPARIKCQDGRPKALLKEAFRADLPLWLVERGKQPFSVPIRQWLKDGLGEFTRDLLLPASAFTQGITNVRPLLSALGGPQEIADPAAARLWSLLTLEVWHREVAGPAARPAAVAQRSRAPGCVPEGGVADNDRAWRPGGGRWLA